MANRNKRETSGNNSGATRETSQSRQEQLTHRLSEQADVLTENAGAMARDARRMADHADSRFREAVSRRPMTSVWTGFGLGVGIGLALIALLPDDRRGRDHWSLDDLTESLRDLGGRAESLGRSAAGRASGYAHDLGGRASEYAHDLGEAASKRVRKAAGRFGL